MNMAYINSLTCLDWIGIANGIIGIIIAIKFDNNIIHKTLYFAKYDNVCGELSHFNL